MHVKLQINSIHFHIKFGIFSPPLFAHIRHEELVCKPVNQKYVCVCEFCHLSETIFVNWFNTSRKKIDIGVRFGHRPLT